METLNGIFLIFRCFLVGFLTWYDNTKFHGYSPSNREVTGGGGGGGIRPPLVIPDFEKLGLFRVNEKTSK